MSLTHLLNCFTIENLVLLNIPRRDAAIQDAPPPVEISSKCFLLFLTTETFSHY